MKLQSMFQKASSRWVCYSGYEFLENEGERYITTAQGAELKIYDPLEIADDIIIDSLNIGVMCIRAKPDETAIEAAIIDFCSKYGLLGFMTALPTTPDFWEYEAVYLPKNPVIRDETMDARDYINSFFPFEGSVFFRDRNKIQQDLFSATDGTATVFRASDRESIALSLAFRELPFAQKMSFHRGYSERYDLIRSQFFDWGTMFCSSVFYFEDTDETLKELHRQAIKAFGGVAPHYHLALTDESPVVVWDFHSLLQEIQIILSYALTDTAKPFRICTECSKVFIAADQRARFCSKECKNRYNVRKSRNKPTTEG